MTKIRKNILLVLALTSVTLLCTACMGSGGTEGLDFYPLSNGTYGVSAGDALYLENIVIPAKHKGKAVTEILPEAFQDADKLQTITIPESVTKIGRAAFANCKNLKEITIPSSITSIDKDAFHECTSLDDVYTSEPEAWLRIKYENGYGHPNFYGELHILDENGNECTEIEIPEGITEIGNYMFANCKSLTSISFAENTDLTKIGSYAFNNCKNLTQINIPDCVTILGTGAFYNSGLTSIVIPNSVTSIGKTAFENCSALTNVVLSNGITEIPYSAFENCAKLTSLILPDQITTVGSFAFQGCTGLESIVISKSMTTVDYFAFEECDGLTTVYYNGTAEDWTLIDQTYGNESLTSSTRYYYSETRPTTNENSHWHYVNGVPTAW